MMTTFTTFPGGWKHISHLKKNKKRHKNEDEYPSKGLGGLLKNE
jgi:hypothetical protein